MRTIYRADKMGDKADSWPMPILKKDKMKLFHIYWVFLFIK